MHQNTCTALLCLLAITGTAYADRVAEVEVTQNYILPPTIAVSAGPSGYQTATTHRVEWNFGLSGHCTPGNHLTGSTLYITRQSTGQWWIADHKWLSEKMIFERHSNRGANLTNAEKALAVAACNDYLAEQMAQGKSRR